MNKRKSEVVMRLDIIDPTIRGTANTEQETQVFTSAINLFASRVERGTCPSCLTCDDVTWTPIRSDNPIPPGALAILSAQKNPLSDDAPFHVHGVCLVCIQDLETLRQRVIDALRRRQFPTMKAAI